MFSLLKFATFAAVFVACGSAPVSLRAGEVSGPARIADADTVYVGETRIRLSGVDAPESDQICLDQGGRPWGCGVEARKRLEDFSRNRPWSCRLTDVDRYGRHIAVCSVDGEDVSRWLVRNGWGLAFRRYSTTYVDDEDEARVHKRGLWGGAFIAPWDWRHRNRATVILGAFVVPTDAQRNLVSPSVGRAVPGPDCVIKANLRNDRCIYHLPGGYFYDRLNMERGASRRWFCSETDAQAAGCRRSKR